MRQCAGGTVPAQRRDMGIAHEVSVAAGHAIQGVRAGADKLAHHKVADGLAPGIEVHSIAFDDGGALPISSTADGVGAPPPLSWHGTPSATQGIVLICEDPDAPALEPFLHWLVYGMSGVTEELDAQSQHDFRLGKNGRDQAGFTPAAPPAGHGVHHYHFQVFALDTAIELGADSDRDAVLEAMKGHVLAWGELVGTYQRE
jgi:hypothetical protein